MLKFYFTVKCCKFTI